MADVWYARMSAHAGDVEQFRHAYLSADEQQRLPTYRWREAADRYVITRSLVRRVLSEHLGLAPRDIHVTRTDTGKPIVTHGIHFNVSHSGDLILCAVSESSSVGVDVERRRDVPRVNALVRRWLGPAEHRELETLVERGVSLSDAFLRIWSLKEARLKALGVGISGASRAAVAAVEAQPLDRLLDALDGPVQDAGYVGAVAFA